MIMLSTVSNLLQQQIPQHIVAQPLPSSSSGVAAEPQSSKKTDDTTTSSLGEDKLLIYGQYVGLAAGGGLAAYRIGGKVAEQMREIAKAFKTPPTKDLPSTLPGVKNLFGSGMQGAGLSAMVAAGVSALSNGVSVMQGKTDSATATKNIIGDALSGALGGFTIVTTAGAGNLLLGSMGVAGLPLTIATVAFGAAGGILGGRLGVSLQAPQIDPTQT